MLSTNRRPVINESFTLALKAILAPLFKRLLNDSVNVMYLEDEGKKME